MAQHAREVMWFNIVNGYGLSKWKTGRNLSCPPSATQKGRTQPLNGGEALHTGMEGIQKGPHPANAIRAICRAVS